MKKILFALALTISSFSVALAAKYDFSTAEKFEASVEAQAKAEGIKQEEMEKKMEAYINALSTKNEEALKDAVSKATSEKEAMELAMKAVFDMLKKDMGEKSLKEILDIK